MWERELNTFTVSSLRWLDYVCVCLRTCPCVQVWRKRTSCRVLFILSPRCYCMDLQARGLWHNTPHPRIVKSAFVPFGIKSLWEPINLTWGAFTSRQCVNWMHITQFIQLIKHSICCHSQMCSRKKSVSLRSYSDFKLLKLTRNCCAMHLIAAKVDGLRSACIWHVS